MKTNNINKIIMNKLCTGCFACKYICQKSAITIEKKEDDFFYPKIEKEICLNCGACLRVCPSEQSLNTKSNSYNTFSGKSESDKAKISSSGGAFYEIAKKIIQKKGVVYGAAWDKNKNIVHYRVSSNNELEKLQGSKYIQSNLNNIYFEIFKDLDNNKSVLFSGTPCQCNALSLLCDIKKVSKENLLIVSVACHGVPSQSLFNTYKRSLEKHFQKEISDYIFRFKVNNKTKIKVCFKDGTFILINPSSDPYNLLFASSESLRESCFNCVSKLNYLCDILLGDYWGLNILEERNDNHSLIMTFTNKGYNIINSCAVLNLKREITPNPGNKNPHILSSAVKVKRENRSFFNNYLYNFNFNDAVYDLSSDKNNKCNGNRNKKRKMNQNVCIATIPDLLNYGNRLQNFALQTFLKSEYKVNITTLWFFNNGNIKQKIKNIVKKIFSFARTFFFFFSSNSRKRINATIFNNKHFKKDNVITSLGTKILRKRRQFFIAGSDQVWNLDYKTISYLFLDFAFPHQKISYAASVGSEMTQSKFETIFKKVKGFMNISFREALPTNYYENKTRPVVSQNIDPVFLLSRKEWLEKLNIKQNKNEKVILVYYLGEENDHFEQIVKKAKEDYCAKVIYFLHAKTNWKKTKYYTKTARDLIKYISISDLVITNSFHGFSLSIIFNKKSILYSSKKEITDLRFAGLENLLKINILYSKDHNYLINNFNWDDVNSIIKKEKGKTKKLFDFYFKR